MRPAGMLAEKDSRSIRSTTAAPACGATVVRTECPGTQPCADSCTGIAARTWRRRRRWLSLSRGLGAASSRTPRPAGPPPATGSAATAGTPSVPVSGDRRTRPAPPGRRRATGPRLPSPAVVSPGCGAARSRSRPVAGAPRVAAAHRPPSPGASPRSCARTRRVPGDGPPGRRGTRRAPRRPACPPTAAPAATRGPPRPRAPSPGVATGRTAAPCRCPRPSPRHVARPSRARRRGAADVAGRAASP
jgi:hypothetical protein